MIQQSPEILGQNDTTMSEIPSDDTLSAARDERALQPVTDVLADLDFTAQEVSTLQRDRDELRKGLRNFSLHLATEPEALIEDTSRIGNHTVLQYLTDHTNFLTEKIRVNKANRATLDGIERLVREVLPQATESKLAQERQGRTEAADRLLTQVSKRTLQTLEALEERDTEIAGKAHAVEEVRRDLAKLIPGLTTNIKFIGEQNGKIRELHEAVAFAEASIRSDQAEIGRLEAEVITIRRDVARETQYVLKDPKIKEIGEIQEKITALEKNQSDNLTSNLKNNQEIARLEEESDGPSRVIDEQSADARELISVGIDAMVSDSDINSLSKYLYMIGDEEAVAAIETYRVQAAMVRRLRNNAEDVDNFTHAQILELVELAHAVFVQHNEYAMQLRMADMGRTGSETIDAWKKVVDSTDKSEKESIGRQTGIAANSFEFYGQLLDQIAGIRTQLDLEAAQLESSLAETTEASQIYVLKGLALRESIAQLEGRTAKLVSAQTLANKKKDEQDVNKEGLQKAVVAQAVSAHQQALQEGDTGLQGSIEDTSRAEAIAADIVDIAAVRRSLTSMARVYEGDVFDLTKQRDVAVADMKRQYREYVEQGKNVAKAIVEAQAAGDEPAQIARTLIAQLRPQLLRVAAETMANQGQHLIYAISSEQLAMAAIRLQENLMGTGQAWPQRVVVALKTGLAIIRGKGTMHPTVRRAIEADPLQHYLMTAIGAQATHDIRQRN